MLFNSYIFLFFLAVILVVTRRISSWRSRKFFFACFQLCVLRRLESAFCFIAVAINGTGLVSSASYLCVESKKD